MTLMLQFDRERCRKLVTVIAVLILGIFATVQVVHGHLPGRVEDAHCALCLVAHGTATLVALPTLPVLAPVCVQPTSLDVPVPTIASSVSFFIRPPPPTV